MTATMQWLSGLIVLGFVLLAIEVFLPGAVIGILGAICLFAAVIHAFVNIGPTGGLLTLGSVLILSMFLIPFWLKMSPRTVVGRKLTLNHSETDYASAPRDFQRYAGKTGIAHSPLRPAGIAIIDGERVDVVTENAFLKAGSRIRVQRVEGARIVVEEVAAS